MRMWDEKAERAIDAAIDQVARELTAGSPSADVRAQVLARIDASGAHARMRRLGWVAPVAVAALLLVAVAIWRKGDVSRPGTPPPAQTTAAQTEPAREEHVEPSTPGLEHPTEEPRTNRRSNVKRTVNPGPGTAASAVAALAPPPLAIDPLRVGAMPAIGSIELSEMTVPSIDVAPLTLDDRPR
jgi:hypothetical protein